MFCLIFILTFGYCLANFERLVLGGGGGGRPDYLGCIEAKFCKQILVGISYLFEKKIEKRDMGRDCWKALAEIYTMHSFAPFSKLNFLLKNR